MRYKYTKSEFEKIKEIVDLALDSPNKVEARKHLKRLNYIAPDVSGPANYILIELSSMAECASGRVQQESQIQMVKTSLYKLESFVEKE